MGFRHKIIISTILQELSYRVPSGIVDLNDREQLSILSEILTEWNLDEIKDELFRNLTEAGEDEDKHFTNPILNKVIQYTDANGEEKEGMIGNLLRQPEGTPPRDAAERQLPTNPVEREKIMQDLGAENAPKGDTTTGDDSVGDTMEQPTGTAFKGEAGDEYRKNLPASDPASTAPKDEPVVNDKKETDINNFSQKSEATEGLFAGPAQYKTVDVGGKRATVRPLIDPETNEALDTSKTNDRLRAIQILDERLASLDKKELIGIQKLEESGVPKNERTAILKWLGEVGELEAYRSLLKSNKVKDTYMLTDSEPKNDLIIIGETEERNLFLKGISVKTTKINEMANKRGSSVKPDLEAGLDTAQTRALTIDGVTDDVDASVMMNSMLELRKRIIKELSMGKARQNPKTKATEVVMEDGEAVSVTEYFRRAKVTPNVINRVFEDDSIFQGKNNPIRSLTDDNVDEPQASQLREHFRQKFVKMISESPDMKVVDLEDKIVDEFINIYDKTGANIVPATDTMISYYQEKGFAENKIIPKEDAQSKIMEVLGVDNFSEIDKKTQFKTILGLDFTGRGMGKKKEGNGYVDGQSFGRPDKRLAPDPRTMDDYIKNFVK